MDSLPFTYLGFSIGGACNVKDVWNSLDEWFRFEVDKWISISLSEGGRLTLDQPVLNKLPCYLFSLMQASVGVINRKEKRSGILSGMGCLVSWLPDLLWWSWNWVVS